MLSCPSRRNVREAHQIWSVLSPFRVSVTKGNWRKKLAQEAVAIYKYGRIVLVNANAIDEYLEMFREPASV